MSDVTDRADLDPDRFVIVGGSGTAIHRPDPDDPERPACLVAGDIDHPRRVRVRDLLADRDLCRQGGCWGSRSGEEYQLVGSVCPLCGEEVAGNVLAAHLASPPGEGCPETPRSEVPAP